MTTYVASAASLLRPACCTWALTEALNEDDGLILEALHQLDFPYIDIRADDFQSAASRQQIQAYNLGLSCMGLSFALPEGVTLGHEDATVRTQALAIVEDGLAQAAALQIPDVYIIPDLDAAPEALSRYADSVVNLADRAATLGIRVGLEHFPGRALPTVAGTLAFIEQLAHPNLYLLFDIGHASMSQEDPVEAIQSAGARLGYVHLDDNDGEDDLHWALLDGVLTETTLRNTLEALQEMGYAGGISLEISPALPDPLDAISRSWQIVQGMLNIA